MLSQTYAQENGKVLLTDGGRGRSDETRYWLPSPVLLPVLLETTFGGFAFGGGSSQENCNPGLLTYFSSQSVTPGPAASA